MADRKSEAWQLCELAYHILDVMHTVYGAAESGLCVEIKSSCERPDPLPAGLPYGTPGS